MPEPDVSSQVFSTGSDSRDYPELLSEDCSMLATITAIL